MRQRIKLSRVCNSDNYTLSKRVHIKYINEEHIKNATVIEKLSISSTSNIVYINCFGTLIPITKEELEIHYTLNTTKTF